MKTSLSSIFLFTILKNYLLNVIRDSKDYCILDNCLEALNVIDNGEIDDVNMEQSQLEVVKKAVQILSPQRRKILTMKISGKYSNQEIADKLNLSVNTIKFQYSQALKQIRLYSFDYSKKVGQYRAVQLFLYYVCQSCHSVTHKSNKNERD